MIKVKLTAICIVALAFFAEIAVAEQALTQHFGDFDSCYTRQYSQDHLAKNPEQTVSYIRFDHTPTNNEFVKYDANTGELEFSVSVNFIDSDKNYSNSGRCHPDGDKLTCNIECDGGGFDIKSKDADSILIYTGEYGFRVSGCGFDDIRGVFRETDDKIFLLHKLPSNQCKN